jgi:hypothetical protein
MSIQIGDLNVAAELIELHYQILKTQIILDRLISSNPEIGSLTDPEMEDIDDQVLAILQKKFPTMGIKKKK